MKNIYASDSLAGGITGRFSNGEIKFSGNTGNISGAYYVGGISGNFYGDCILDACYNRGDVEGRFHEPYTQACYIGGICGYVQTLNSESYCGNCYNTGNISSLYENIRWHYWLHRKCFHQ